jgi:hypothetical protein
MIEIGESSFQKTKKNRRLRPVHPSSALHCTICPIAFAMADGRRRTTSLQGKVAILLQQTTCMSSKDRTTKGGRGIRRWPHGSDIFLFCSIVPLAASAYSNSVVQDPYHSGLGLYCSQYIVRAGPGLALSLQKLKDRPGPETERELKFSFPFYGIIYQFSQEKSLFKRVMHASMLQGLSFMEKK